MSDNDNLTYGVVETMGDDVFIIFFQSTLNKRKQNDIANLRFFLQTVPNCCFKSFGLSGLQSL